MLVPLKLSEINFLPIKPQGSLIGFASLVINHSLYAGAIGVHTRPDGSFRLLFPDRLLPTGKRIQVFHPITREAEEIFCKAVAEKINQLAAKGQRDGCW